MHATLLRRLSLALSIDRPPLTLPAALGSIGCPDLAELLPQLASLTALDLTDNKLSAYGVASLAEGLAGNRSLTVLEIGRVGEQAQRSYIDRVLELNLNKLEMLQPAEPSAFDLLLADAKQAAAVAAAASRGGGGKKGKGSKKGKGKGKGKKKKKK